MIATSTKLRGPRCERIGPREISVIKVVFEPRLTILKYGERSKSHEMPYRSRGRRWLHRRRFVEICQLQHADLPAYRTVREGVPQGHRVHGRSNRPPIRHAQHGGPVALPPPVPTVACALLGHRGTASYAPRNPPYQAPQPICTWAGSVTDRLEWGNQGGANRAFANPVRSCADASVPSAVGSSASPEGRMRPRSTV